MYIILFRFCLIITFHLIKVIASPGNRATDIPGMEETCDHVARLIAAVLRLCEVERRASDAGCILFIPISTEMNLNVSLL